MVTEELGSQELKAEPFIVMDFEMSANEIFLFEQATIYPSVACRIVLMLMLKVFLIWEV